MAVLARPSGAGQPPQPDDAAGDSGDALQTLSALLTSHRTHLLSLYTTLGHVNPQGHVSTKITELHSSLIATVQGQAKEAEDEVEGLKKEAENVEGRIKDKNLLVRLERLKKVETGLAEVMEARQAQVDSLRKRLEEYAPVLGEAVIRQAVRGEPNADRGEDAEENLSLARIQKLEEECVKCDTEISQRNQQLVSHLQEIFNIWGDLGISPSLSPTSPTPDTAALLGLDPTTAADVPASDFADFDHLVLAHLGIKGTTLQVNGEIAPSGRCEPEEMLATDENLRRASGRRAHLEAQRADREKRIQELYDEVCPLWNRLGVPETEQEEFIESWKGLSEACITGYQAELDRMHAARAEHMSLFVGKEREQIEALWNQMYVGEEERASLAILQSDAYSEELLLAHELERKRLEEDLADRGPVLALLDRYFGLIQEAQELEMAEKDPNRYAKGKRGVPGQLLREEKIRKRVAKEKPRLEQDLQTLIPEWENERGKPFLVNGSRFLEDLVAKLEQEAASKESKRVRPGTAAPPSVGPIKRQQTGNGAPSRPASPTKRPRTATVSRVQPQRTGGGPIPFGSLAQNGATRAAPMTAQKTGTGAKLTAQKTGGGATSVMRGGPSMLMPQATGTSMYYNPVTPTPNYGGASGVMLAPATTLPRPGQGRAVQGMGLPAGWGASHAQPHQSGSGHDRLFSPDPAADAGGVSAFGRKMSFRPRPSATGVGGVRTVSGSTVSSYTGGGHESVLSFGSARTGTSFATSVGGASLGPGK